jgi:hypothetical protein
VLGQKPPNSCVCSHVCFCTLQVGALPAAGFVNGLALGKSGTLAVAALGQVRWVSGCDPIAGCSHFPLPIRALAAVYVGGDANDALCVGGCCRSRAWGAGDASGLRAMACWCTGGAWQPRAATRACSVGVVFGNSHFSFNLSTMGQTDRGTAKPPCTDLRQRLLSTHTRLLQKHPEPNLCPVALVSVTLLRGSSPSLLQIDSIAF